MNTQSLKDGIANNKQDNKVAEKTFKQMIAEFNDTYNKAKMPIIENHMQGETPEDKGEFNGLRKFLLDIDKRTNKGVFRHTMLHFYRDSYKEKYKEEIAAAEKELETKFIFDVAPNLKTDTNVATLIVKLKERKRLLAICNVYLKHNKNFIEKNEDQSIADYIHAEENRNFDKRSDEINSFCCDNLRIKLTDESEKIFASQSQTNEYIASTIQDHKDLYPQQNIYQHFMDKDPRKARNIKGLEYDKEFGYKILQDFKQSVEKWCDLTLERLGIACSAAEFNIKLNARLAKLQPKTEFPSLNMAKLIKPQNPKITSIQEETERISRLSSRKNSGIFNPKQTSALSSRRNSVNLLNQQTETITPIVPIVSSKLLQQQTLSNSRPSSGGSYPGFDIKMATKKLQDMKKIGKRTALKLTKINFDGSNINTI